MTPARPDGDAPRPPRRRRYSGTHPRAFDERYKERDPQRYPDIQQHIRDQGRTPAGTHTPVLLAEVLACLAPQPGEVVVDCTLGYGGHGRALIERLSPGGVFVGLDVDAAQLACAPQRLGAAAEGHSPPSVKIGLLRSNFAGLAQALRACEIVAADAILADLGLSSMQIDDPGRGFSYKHDGPLDMRMDQRRPRTAADLLQALPQQELADAFRELADEPDADAIAAQIVAARRVRPLTRTLDLVDAVFAAKGMSRHAWKRAGSTDRELHPAGLTFQALRILVNDELAALAALLRAAPYCLKPGGRIAIISFHSGEDRLVKRAFRDGLDAGTFAVISEEVIRPGPVEQRENPRSASAKLRWARTPA
ncbi:Ribosomal RNA small subunit methyltransferase H [Phycisphaerae bacterium RAS1]|nr:Ribosomal RNA small subunit methyltransferase H [Phycisphaerae bacterium RAS1]